VWRRRHPVRGPSAVVEYRRLNCLSDITKFCTREYRWTAMRELGLRANVRSDGDRDATHQRRAGQSVSLRCELCGITCERSTCFHSTSERYYLISSLHTSRSPSHEKLRSVMWKNNLFDLSSRRASQHFLLRLEVIILLFSLHPHPHTHPPFCLIHCDCFLYKNLWVTSYVFWCKGSNVPFFKKSIDWLICFLWHGASSCFR
jgi:hypothetical protein